MEAAAATHAPVLILGAGVNGLCVARELAVNGIPVIVVDRCDLGGGATAKSSRLIHGGLRYLEYGEFHLVRESLDERTRLLRLAPHFVRPLRLHIPVSRRSGGLIRAAVRFCGGARVGWLQRLLDALHVSPERGLWAARIGLTLYDWIARSGRLPRHSVTPLAAGQGPPVDAHRYRWLCSYWDAQMAYPERFCVALAQDAALAAHEAGTSFQLLTYHDAQLIDGGVRITPRMAQRPESQLLRLAMIVNATGAWGDLTLERLAVPAPRLFGGTRGSHIVTRRPQLLQALGEEAIYAEAPDGRLVFLIPWAGAALIGTTDERCAGPPEEAVAADAEIAYLVEMVNLVLPDVGLTRSDVESHYSGVRPLPYVPAGKTGAITRDHAFDTRTVTGGLRIDTIIGGKLTTCRALGELAADRVLQHLGRRRTVWTTDRPLPGSDRYPGTPVELAAAVASLETEFSLSPATAAAVWTLLGAQSADVLREAGGGNSSAAAGEAFRDLLPGTSLPLAVVDWVIAHESALTVADLVERRLLLVFTPGLNRATLEALDGRIRAVTGSGRQTADAAAESLRRNYGIRIG